MSLFSKIQDQMKVTLLASFLASWLKVLPSFDPCQSFSDFIKEYPNALDDDFFFDNLLDSDCD